MTKPHEHPPEDSHELLSKETEESERRLMIARLCVSAALLAPALVLPLDGGVKALLSLLSFAAAGYDIVLDAVKNVVHGHFLDEKFLMAVAALGAFLLGEYPEGAAVALLFQTGEFFQDAAVDHSRKSITSLLALRPEEAHVEREGTWVDTAPENVTPGEIILIRPGERIPLDGVILEGRSALDTVALTGESLPRDVREGDEVLSGCVNGQGILRVRVTKNAADSAVARILELVENAGEHKSRADRFITRFARVYTPAVVGGAVLLAVLPPLIWGNFAFYARQALNFLVISCPCALVLSVPLTYFSGIGASSHHGILVKGADTLEALAAPGIVAMDKTGTVTKGVFTVTQIEPEGMDAETLLYLAAAAEQHSTHPIAQAILSAWQGKALPPLASVREIPGHGLIARVEDREIAVGNERLMARYGLACPVFDGPGTVSLVAADGVYAGAIRVSDAIREDAKSTVQALRQLGVAHIALLTGDRANAADAVAAAIGADEVFSSLLPEDKVHRAEGLLAQKAKGKTFLFLGDGINDAPVLARSDVGIAMGGLGSDAAIEAADAVLMEDRLDRLPLAIRIARKTQRIVRENIVISLAVKGLILLMSVLGLAGLWMAVLADVGVCLLAVANALRALRA